MDEFYHSVKSDEPLCKGCINCIRRCPAKAIRMRGSKASINNKFCINCGKCIRVCPRHTKHATYSKIDVTKQYECTVALPVPSLYSQFNNLNDVNIVLSAPMRIGFDDVFEVSAATELVSETTRQCISGHEEQLPFIGTTCPSTVRLTRIQFPNLVLHLLPLNPPVEVAVILAAERAMKDTGLPKEKIGIVFISPCPSKVTYVKTPLGAKKSQVGHVPAIKDVYPKLLTCMKVVVAEDYPAIGTSGKIGISWGHSGGGASGLFIENYLAAGGIESVIWVLENMEDQKFTNLRFVELNACNGGCVGGVLTVENPYVAEIKPKRLRKYMPVARNRMHDSEERLIKWITGVRYEPIFSLGNNMTEGFSRLNQVERLMKKFPGLDCGSHGALTCKALAEDIVRGDVNETDHIYYLRENLHGLSEEVSVLAGNSYNGDKDGQEILCTLKEYIQRASGEMSLLDKKDEEEEELRQHRS